MKLFGGLLRTDGKIWAGLGFLLCYLVQAWLPNPQYFLGFFIVDCISCFQRTIIGASKDKNACKKTLSTAIHLMVLPSQIDRNWHMNNASYIQVLNSSRRHLFNTFGLWSFAHKYGVNFIIQAQSVRYRKELSLFESYYIVSKISGWSEAQKCFYIETRFVTRRSEKDKDFVNAIHYLKYRIVSNMAKVSPLGMLKTLGLVDDSFALEECYDILELQQISQSLNTQDLSTKPSIGPAGIRVNMGILCDNCSRSEVTGAAAGTCTEPAPAVQGEKARTIRKYDAPADCFIGHWEVANRLCSRRLNPNKPPS